jgi:hypothetical protein
VKWAQHGLCTLTSAGRLLTLGASHAGSTNAQPKPLVGGPKFLNMKYGLLAVAALLLLTGAVAAFYLPRSPSMSIQLGIGHARYRLRTIDYKTALSPAVKKMSPGVSAYPLQEANLRPSDGAGNNGDARALLLGTETRGP